MIAAADQDAVSVCRYAYRGGARLLLAAMLAVVLAGCKTSGALDAIETGAISAAGPANTATVGSGPVAVALFIDSTRSPQLAADRRDGAVLAVDQLGKDQVTLTIYEAGAASADSSAEIETAVSAGAKLLIGPAGLIASPVWTKAPAAKRPPVILLAPPPAKPIDGVLALVSDETASAAEIAAYAVAAGKTQILVAAPAALPPKDVARLKKAVEAKKGTFVGVVTAPSVLAEKDKALPARADAVVLYGSAPAAALASLKDAGLRNDAWILGTSEWTPGAYIEGAYFAAIDQNGFRHIAGSFRTAYGRSLSAEAAYAYDAVAVAAGIVRANGADGISAAALHSKAGFSGATGPFRFAGDGRVERRFSIYKVAGGVPKLYDAAPVGF
jgi:hypothetical protein